MWIHQVGAIGCGLHVLATQEIRRVTMRREGQEPQHDQSWTFATHAVSPVSGVRLIADAGIKLYEETGSRGKKPRTDGWGSMCMSDIGIIRTQQSIQYKQL